MSKPEVQSESENKALASSASDRDDRRFDDVICVLKTSTIWLL